MFSLCPPSKDFRFDLDGTGLENWYWRLVQYEATWHLILTPKAKYDVIEIKRMSNDFILLSKDALT